jgi:hypothetical protein
VIHCDDPTKTVGYTLSVSDRKVYLTVSEIESDVYVMDMLVRQVKRDYPPFQESMRPKG